MTRVQDKEYRTIYGGYTTNCCAMCFSKRHTGALTVAHMKKHGCLKKQCDRLAIFEDHPYWQQRALTKSRKKENNDRIRSN